MDEVVGLRLVMYRQNNRKRGPGKPKSQSFEKALYFSFMGIFALLILVQVSMLSPNIRASLTMDSNLEGTALGQEEMLYKEGTLNLELQDGENSDVKILVNGEAVAVFSSQIVSVSVKDGDVVEIDGSAVNESAEAFVSSASGDFDPACLESRVVIDSNIKKLVKVKLR